MGVEDLIRLARDLGNLDGKRIGEDNDFINVDLSDTNKQAWVKHMVEQYLKKEPIEEPPEEYKITKKDFAKEAARMEIKKIFDRGK